MKYLLEDSTIMWYDTKVFKGSQKVCAGYFVKAYIQSLSTSSNSTGLFEKIPVVNINRRKIPEIVTK